MLDIRQGDKVLEIRNGTLAVRLSDDLPLFVWSLGDDWLGSSRIVGTHAAITVHSEVVESSAAMARWRTTYRFDGQRVMTSVATWQAGTDTICVVDEIAVDTGAWLEWRPFGDDPTRAYIGGGGEGAGPMQRLSGTVRLSHIAYQNQWCQAWVGFAADTGTTGFCGIFSGWGSQWRRRGYVRPEVDEDSKSGHFLRLPLAAGRSCYGIVLTRANPESKARCILNRRKTEFTDVPAAKTDEWVLDVEPGPRAPRLLPTPLRADLTLRSPAELVAIVERWEERLYNGGYEGIIIFQGRELKSIAFDLDALWALDRIDAATYKAIARGFLILAYVFADPDYCNYDDFWPHAEADEGIADALRDEMGDTPVPPNFAAEYFSSFGVVAELFPQHPMANTWRDTAIALSRQFLATQFAADGTYVESINYHSHCISELLCFFYPLWLHERYDFFQDPAVKGSFRHFLHLQMPHLVSEGCAPLPNNGNSGGDGRQQPFRGDLTVAAAVYKHSDSELAANLMHAWHTGGKPLADREHPVLTEVTLDLTIEAVAAPWESCLRSGLGVVSKSYDRHGEPVWCLFRAGSATHHMDFDQGHVHLAAGGQVWLGDYGYHAKTDEGTPLVCWETWLHNTLVYSDDKYLTSGYTGLELAPEPICVHLSAAFDWCVHRIVNTQHRDARRFPYNRQLPAGRTVHVRHYLMRKPDYLVIWDVFEEAVAPSLFMLHPTSEPRTLADGHFRCGPDDALHLDILILQPRSPRIVENRACGPLWSLAVEQPQGAGYLAIIAPTRDTLSAQWAEDSRTLTIDLAGRRETVVLPPAGSTNTLPVQVFPN